MEKPLSLLPQPIPGSTVITVVREGGTQPPGSLPPSTCTGQGLRPQALALQQHLTCGCSSLFLPAWLVIMDAKRALQGDKETIKALMEHGGPVLARTVDKDARR